jgi:hypothetical protein
MCAQSKIARRTKAIESTCAVLDCPTDRPADPCSPQLHLNVLDARTPHFRQAAGSRPGHPLPCNLPPFTTFSQCRTNCNAIFRTKDSLDNSRTSEAMKVFRGSWTILLSHTDRPVFMSDGMCLFPCHPALVPSSSSGDLGICRPGKDDAVVSEAGLGQAGELGLKHVALLRLVHSFTSIYSVSGLDGC